MGPRYLQGGTGGDSVALLYSMEFMTRPRCGPASSLFLAENTRLVANANAGQRS